ncbi:MAG: class I tRNA ligase family protein [bacterium]
MTDEFKKSTNAQKEEEILTFWRDNEIFQKTVSKKSPNGDFVFYDGPPFATGLPHYGHLLAGTIKDAIPRYQTMRGKAVRRQWGWDCHGLPIENLIEKELGLKNKQDIEIYGVEKFNDAAKSSVLRYDKEWKEIIPRVGRFVDMDHSYKTMDWTYSESIWWAFSELYKKDFAYEGYKSMHICPRCETTLANSEVAQGYKDIKDLSVIAKFELVDEPNTFVLAWTTTPWTLPGNVALAVGKDISYVKVKIDKGKYSGETYIIAGERMTDILQKSGMLGDAIDPLKDSPVELIAEIVHLKGSDLIGKAYKPLFDYYANKEDLENRENGWKIYAADFVTTEEGTGVVHIAPAFGEDDMNLGAEYKLPFVQHVKMNGTFTDEVIPFAGMPVKSKDAPQSTDIEIIKYLAKEGKLFLKEKYEHSYPHCWRCDTPLLNYAASSWFIKVTALRDRLVESNKNITWVPENIRDGRFGKWLEGARDWAVSRSRYWGAPLPVWKCNTCETVEVCGSVEEVKKMTKLSGNNYFIVRHGEAESNAGNFVSSNVSNKHHLTKKGESQVVAVATELKERKITRIFSSDFVRTRETAECIAETIGFAKEDIIFDTRLREVNTGDFDGKPVQEYFDFFNSIEEKFVKRPPNGETASEIKQRVGNFLYDIEKQYHDENILIVSHEYPLWLLCAAATGADVERASDMKRARVGEFIFNAELQELPFIPLPHNRDYELDVHRPYIDEIVFSCPCGGEKHRIPEVFDCWFESGSMPYAQFHYPFENKELFERNFPADFIAEGVDQTRGWFYTLLVLSVGLFDKAAFKNVIVNGLILAEDGQKMSKRLKNYPDPLYLVNRYGADALRYYMLSSPVVHGEELRFSEKGVDEVFKKVILRLNNVCSFYDMYADVLHTLDMHKGSTHVLDLWIQSRLNQLISEVESAMDKYTLDQAVKPIASFIDGLSTWYLRRSRDRFKSHLTDSQTAGEQVDENEDKLYAIATTRYVLETLAKVMAPFMPFIAEEVYQKVTVGICKAKKYCAATDTSTQCVCGCKDSVHLQDWPTCGMVDMKKITAMQEARSVVEATLAARSKTGIKVRQPLESVFYTTTSKESFPVAYEAIIADEINVKKVIFKEEIATDDLQEDDRYQIVEGDGVIVVLHTEITDELRKEGNFRDLVRCIQDIRKKQNLTPRDAIVIRVFSDNEGIQFIKSCETELQQATNAEEIIFEIAALENAYSITIGSMTFSLFVAV